jgi:hypothetical protein
MESCGLFIESYGLFMESHRLFVESFPVTIKVGFLSESASLIIRYQSLMMR